MVENSAYCACTLHDDSSNNSMPHSQHKMLQDGLNPNSCCGKPVTHVRHIRKRSKSPGSSCRCHHSTSSSRQNWAATLSNSTASPKTADVPSNNQKHVVLKTSVSNVEKTNSCPDRTCSFTSKISSSSSKPYKRCSIKSLSTVQVSNAPDNCQMARHIGVTEEIVSELKGEIEKVKHQLHHMSHHKTIIEEKENDPESANSPNKIIMQLKSENRRLKQELEHKKKKQLESVKEVEKARDIMSDYEKKVGLLHQQALKSSKIMKQSKDKFCKCLQEKEYMITQLKKDNDELSFSIGEKEQKYTELSQVHEKLQQMCQQNSKKCGMLSENNQTFCECIEWLESQLQNSLSESEKYKGEIKKLEQHLSSSKCSMCHKLEMKGKKQKERFDARLKEYEDNEHLLKMQVAELTDKIKELDSEKLEQLQTKTTEYEKCASRCKQLEEDCKQYCETIRCNELQFDKERGDLRQLVDELTTVVKQNKITLLQLSNINREQEALLETQSVVISEKEERIKWAESTLQMMRTRSVELEQEMDDLRSCLTGPCSREACCCISRQLEETKNALHVEKDNQLVKQKIIEDQSQTICSLQIQIKDKIEELIKARQATNCAQDEISKINNDLIQKHSALEQELIEKEHLQRKLKKLETQKSQLGYEMKELEKLLDNYHQSSKCDEKHQAAISNLQKQIEQQRREWEVHKETLYAEKEKAIAAAKFATQKLLDTVADFQTQVQTQRKVQNMLTKMLHEKEEELKTIKSKMNSINSITSNTETDIPMNEIYKRQTNFDASNGGTSSSFYSFCSNCSKHTSKSSQNVDKTNLKQLFTMLTRTDDEPIKES